MTAPRPTVVVLGAGASRAVSYSDKKELPSPLDADFFDLLQRLTPRSEDQKAVRRVLSSVSLLPLEYWRSLERAFFTLQLRAYLHGKLEGRKPPFEDEAVIADFARSIQAVLRAAHGTAVCTFHTALTKRLHAHDTFISFNYDLVPERAIWKIAIHRQANFGPWLYGFESGPKGADIPLILKLHGSANWRFTDWKAGRLRVLTHEWDNLSRAPGYLARGVGTKFPIFLPFWDKRIEQRPWLPLWQGAYEKLKRAGKVVVWGYSLPRTDIKAQHLFRLALEDRNVKLCVIDPSSETRGRWRELLRKAKFWEYRGIDKFLDHPPSWW